MKKALVRRENQIIGMHSDITGNVSGITGNVYGITGDVSGIWGDVDECGLTSKCREIGVDIQDLVKD